MFLNFLKNNRIVVFLLVAFTNYFFIIPSYLFAESMNSSTYKIESDSLNFGGAPSNSDTYKIEDTMGEIGTGDSNSATYYMHSGYQQMGESYISISSPSDLVMGSMGGLSGGSSEGTMSWKVTTDNTAGYEMTIKAGTNPAMQSLLDSLDDYIPSGVNPDYNFINSSNTSSFGFSPEGTEVTDRFKDDNNSLCNTDSHETTGKCWDGLSTTPKVIAGSTSSNIPNGSDITVRFRAESGPDHIQTSGTYSVIITATATAL